MPTSPNEITVIGDDGTPLGKYIKKKKPSGEYEYVHVDDGTPLGVAKIPVLPKTGGTSVVWFYTLGSGLILTAGYLLKRRKKDGDKAN